MATCRVKSRKFTGVGFFTYFDVDPRLHEQAPLRSRFVITLIGAEITGLKNGGFFALFIDNLHFLFSMELLSLRTGQTRSRRFRWRPRDSMSPKN